MVSNIIRLSLGSMLFLLTAACVNKPLSNQKTLGKGKIVDTCRYYRYEAGQIISTLGCRNCHLAPDLELKDDRGWPTFRGLANMDSLKLIKYVFKEAHKGWYSKTGTFKASRMDTLNDCEIKGAIQYIKDAGRSIAIPSQ
ncbi:hypothetical protein EV200_101259 [Pedobacter psychrotolerans]|uniref:Cytochrome c domain-containing protein n=2 Tax=Pedobacter psychrotolerans TaxID=1843235 RepID=A0A4R2HL77_9SPHI|nr:hypothetical protein [Pedobacter psychrotolerans]TCO30820.1 hypothetical protein EV200_101259 [Pedobacter psychrotolerans]